MNQFHLIARWYVGTHTYYTADRGDINNYPPTENLERSCERIVHARNLAEAKTKLIDYVWSRKVHDPYKDTEWAVKEIYLEEKYEHLI